MSESGKKYLNNEINNFISDNFPLKEKEFKNENQLLSYFVEIENDLYLKLYDILQKNPNISFKTKQRYEYILKENLIVSYEQSIHSENINYILKKNYKTFLKNILSKINFDKIQNEENENIVNDYLFSEILRLNQQFIEYLNKIFDRNSFPNFLITKYKDLLKERYLTLASSQGIDITKIIFDSFQLETASLFERIFITREENMFLSNSKNESYKVYLDYVMLCNYSYLKNEDVLDIFFKYSPYLYYLFNLNEINKNSEFNEIFVINQMISQLLKENLEITKEEAEKKLDLIQKEFGNETRKILSIILCLTLIFNGLIVKNKITSEIFFVGNIKRIITSAKMKIILLNALIPFEKYVDVEDISNFSQSIIIHSLLPLQDNLSYDIREIKNILINPISTKEEISNTNNPFLKTFSQDFNIICPEKDLLSEKNKTEIENISSQIFSKLITDKQNSLVNFLDNLIKERKDNNIRNISLQSLNPKSRSTHCIIFVSGFLSENEDHISEWDNLTIKINKSNICYYYNWPSENIKSLTGDSLIKFSKLFLQALGGNDLKNNNFNIKPEEIFVNSSKKAKLSGKILALIIASKLFFKYETISLIVFSLGTQVIVNCIKMLYKINSIIKCNDIIKDVILIAGATSMENKEKHYAEIFDNIVNGKIINCWSNEDKVLSILYVAAMKKNAIGYGGKFNLNIEKFKSLDFTSLKLGHTDYRNKMDLVMDKIRLMG